MLKIYKMKINKKTDNILKKHIHYFTKLVKNSSQNLHAVGTNLGRQNCRGH